MRFTRLKEDHLEMVLNWRTSDFVTKFMYTDVDFDIDKQRSWFKKIDQDPFSYYWTIENRGIPIGLISITNMDHTNKKAFWNFYIGEPKYSLLAGFIGPAVYNFAFETFGLNKLIGEVMLGNESVRSLHLKQGAREVGFYKEHIWKNNQFHDVYIYEMTRDDWFANGKKFSSIFAEVELDK